MENGKGERHHAVMATKKVQPHPKPARPRYFFKEWRKYRGHNQAELAELVGVSVSSISQLETGKQGFTDSTLSALADALHCNPGDLLMRNPLDEDAVWSIWDHIPKEDKPTAIRILQGFAKTGTEG